MVNVEQLIDDAWLPVEGAQGLEREAAELLVAKAQASDPNVPLRVVDVASEAEPAPAPQTPAPEATSKRSRKVRATEAVEPTDEAKEAEMALRDAMPPAPEPERPMADMAALLLLDNQIRTALDSEFSPEAIASDASIIDFARAANIPASGLLEYVHKYQTGWATLMAMNTDEAPDPDIPPKKSRKKVRPAPVEAGMNNEPTAPPTTEQPAPQEQPAPEPTVTPLGKVEPGTVVYDADHVQHVIETAYKRTGGKTTCGDVANGAKGWTTDKPARSRKCDTCVPPVRKPRPELLPSDDERYPNVAAVFGFNFAAAPTLAVCGHAAIGLGATLCGDKPNLAKRRVWRRLDAELPVTCGSCRRLLGLPSRKLWGGTPAPIRAKLDQAWLATDEADDFALRPMKPGKARDKVIATYKAKRAKEVAAAREARAAAAAGQG